jgi:hypothetical protein
MDTFTVVLVTGMLLWHTMHEGSFGGLEWLLTVGALRPVAMQASLVGPKVRQVRTGGPEPYPHTAKGNRMAAGLFALAAVCVVRTLSIGSLLHAL